MSNVTNLIGFLQLCSVQNDLSLALVDILKTAREQKYFHTIIYARHADMSAGEIEELYNVDDVAKGFGLPMIQLRGKAPLYLWPVYNRQLLALLPMSGNEEKDKHMLESLWQVLRRSVRTRLLLVFKQNAEYDIIENMLKFCMRRKAINVLAVKESLPSTGVLYTIQIYPQFKVTQIELSWPIEIILYKDQVKNLYGQPLRLNINKGSTKLYILNRVNNTYRLGGHVGHFMQEFAHIHNASIVFPNLGDENNTFITDVEMMLDNGTFDISTEPSFNLYNSDRVYSNIFDYMDWCVMVPVEKPIPAFMYYSQVVDDNVWLLLLGTVVILSLLITLTIWLKNPVGNRLRLNFFNIYIFSGILGQSFKMETNFNGVRSALYMLTCIAGIIMNTSYTTYLQTFNALSPRDKMITNLDDLHETGMRLLMYNDEYNMIKAYGQEHIFRSVVTLTSFEEFMTLRNNFDTRYVYPVPSAQWLLYQQQQKFFTKPRYRLSDIWFVKMIGLMIPLQANSRFEDDINRMIGQVEESGLLSHWKFLTFLESVQLKRINLLDNSPITGFEPMKVEDTRLVMYSIIIMAFVSFCCFVFEFLWFRRMTFWHKIKRIRDKNC